MSPLVSYVPARPVSLLPSLAVISSGLSGDDQRAVGDDIVSRAPWPGEPSFCIGRSSSSRPEFPFDFAFSTQVKCELDGWKSKEPDSRVA